VVEAVQEEALEAVIEEAKVEVLVLERCIRQLVLSVDRNVKFLLSLQKASLFFVENVLQKEEKIGINDSLSE
jgi:hypothetical protein